MDTLPVLGILGTVISLIPLVILPLKIKAEIPKYIGIYIFLVLYYLSISLYFFWPSNYILSIAYILQMLFFLNMYKAYLKKELLFAIPMIFSLINALAILFTFYFITFNLFELIRDIKHKKKTSPLVLSSIVLFEGGVILQILQIVFKNIYINVWPLLFFIFATILFIIPGLRVAYEEEKI